MTSTMTGERGAHGAALLTLDVDFVHPADPGAPSREPARCLARLRHVHEAAMSAFGRHGVVPLVVLNPAGYRYLARVPSGGRLHRELVSLGRTDGWAAAACRTTSGSAAAAAHRGAGRLVEFLAHEIVRTARAAGGLPVSLADVAPAGPDPFAMVDPSAYADGAEDVYLRSRAAAQASACRAAIPAVPEDASLLRDYERSALAAFHAELDHSPLAADWARRPAGLFDPESAPPCANAVLRYPAPRLLQPRHLRTVALSLWSTGWHPRAIAALVCARYQEPHDWGTHWQRHEPERTAAFFVRLFCAAAACGLDDGLFACQTEARHGLCPAGGCGYDLGQLFRRLRSQRAREEAHA